MAVSPWNTEAGKALLERHKAGELTQEEAAAQAGATVQSLKSKLGWDRRHAAGIVHNSRYQRRAKEEAPSGLANELIPLIDMGADAIGRAFKRRLEELQAIIKERTEALEHEKAARERLEREFAGLRQRFEERAMKVAGLTAPD